MIAIVGEAGTNSMVLGARRGLADDLAYLRRYTRPATGDRMRTSAKLQEIFSLIRRRVGAGDAAGRDVAVGLTKSISD